MANGPYIPNVTERVRGFDAIDTKANLDALTREEGKLYYATDEDKVYTDDGTTLNELGAGGGGSISTCRLTHGTGNGTDGGTYSTALVWQTRPLSSIVDNGTGITLSSNQITIPAGKWYLTGWFSFFRTDQSRLRLQNITDATTEAKGPGGYSAAGDETSPNLNISAYIDLASTKTFEIQHFGRRAETSSAFGVSVSEGGTEVWANVNIFKVG
jgi:hypothetical protein